MAEVRAIGTEQGAIAWGQTEPFQIVIDYVAPGVANKTSARIIRQVAF
jgi:hypothetical protein